MINEKNPELDKFIKPLDNRDDKYVLDLPKIMSYNSDWLFINSLRGTGKSFSILQYMLEDITKHLGELQMFLVAREEEELKQAVGTDGSNLLLDVWQKTPWLRDNFTYRKNSKRIIQFAKIKRNKDGDRLKDSDLEWHDSVNLIYLTGSMRRSVAYTKVKYVLFDEFQITDPIKRYVPGEYTKFMNFLSTVFRDRDAKVFMLSNSGSLFNPYFDGIGYTTPEQEVWTRTQALSETGIGKGKRIKINVFNLKVDPDKFKTANIAGAFGTEDMYANDYGLDTSLVAELNETSRIDCNFTVDGKDYSLYLSRHNKKIVYIIAKGHNKGAKFTLSDNFMTGESLRDNGLGIKIRKYAKLQSLYFDSIETRELLTSFVNKAY